MMSQMISDRGHFLFGQVPSAGELPVLTAEAYCKWYTLYLIKPGGDCERIGYDKLEAHTPAGQSPYVDHTPNPEAVMNMANANGWHLPDIVYELMVGRWVLDNDRYP